MSTAFVTGATGMVGGALVRRLVDAGDQVVVLVLDPDPQSELYRSGLVTRTTIVSGALEDLHALERAVAIHEPDAVYHLGAQTIVGAAHRSPLTTLEANVRGTWNVLEACRCVGHRPAIVVASSDKAYGTVDELPYTEAMPLAGHEPYEVSKAAADLIAQMYAHTYGMPIAIARCGNIYGPGDLNWSRIVPGTVRSLLRDEQPVLRSDGTFVRDYLHVDDVVDGYLALAGALTDGTIASGDGWNFSDESPRTVREIYDAVCSAADRPGTEPLVLDRAPGEIHDQWLSAAKARAQLDWKPRVELDRGLTTTVEWYRSYLGR